ncbi:pirin family protein [Galbibacter pacificus]|uniref:pirin family protein n=1 Tax=Galbibacter pacificus TaxID=2996052 RepID=UPI0038B3D5B9
MVGLFIFIDHMGPATIKKNSYVDIGQHPHIGLSTLTYLFEGEIRHRDSLGSDQVITAGVVNWMTAGNAVMHTERTPRTFAGQRIIFHAWFSNLGCPIQRTGTNGTRIPSY